MPKDNDTKGAFWEKEAGVLLLREGIVLDVGCGADRDRIEAKHRARRYDRVCHICLLIELRGLQQYATDFALTIGTGMSGRQRIRVTMSERGSWIHCFSFL